MGASGAAGGVSETDGPRLCGRHARGSLRPLQLAEDPRDFLESVAGIPDEQQEAQQQQDEQTDMYYSNDFPSVFHYGQA